MSGGRTIQLAASLGAATLVLGSCGGSEPTEEESAAVAVLVDAELSNDEESCVLDGLQASGISLQRVIDDELTADEDGELLAVTVGCVDDLAVIDGFVESFIVGTAEEGTVLSEDEARCAIRALGDSDADDAIVSCLSDEALDSLEDPTIELLTDQCRRGNNQACDELFRVAPADSEASLYGQTCGNRLPENEGSGCPFP